MTASCGALANDRLCICASLCLVLHVWRRARVQMGHVSRPLAHTHILVCDGYSQRILTYHLIAPKTRVSNVSNLCMHPPLHPPLPLPLPLPGMHQQQFTHTHASAISDKGTHLKVCKLLDVVLGVSCARGEGITNDAPIPVFPSEEV